MAKPKLGPEDAWDFRPKRPDFTNRVRQCAVWCQAQFPTPASTEVVVVPRLLNPDNGRPYYGETSLTDKGTFLIHVSYEQLLREAYDTLIHEWSHALTWLTVEPWYQNDNPKFHSDYFWMTHGRIRNRWEYDGGIDAARGL